jgi:gamma-glutamyl:cysteine ligase YbdK (ATP-grasp superfamily)
LRKYNTQLYRSQTRSRKGRQILLVGGWNDRFAGTHIHLSLADRAMKFGEAQKLAAYIHDHLPLIMAIMTNSPVWDDRITCMASNRILKGSKKYFHPIMREGLTKREFDEMTYSHGRVTKPPTLELRGMDSNIPEFVMAAACIIKACVMAYLRRKKSANVLTHYRYLRSRQDAARKGMQAKLCWNDEWLPATEYLDRFFWVYRKELKEMDIPYEIIMVFKLLKKGINGSSMIHEAAQKAYETHPQTWQKRFAKRYDKGINLSLSGNSLAEFMQELKIKLPNLSQVWLGRKKMGLL